MQGDPCGVAKSVRLALLIWCSVTACGGSVWAEDGMPAAQESTATIRDSIEAIEATNPAGERSLHEADRFDPLEPVDTAGPREALTDFLGRMGRVQSIFRFMVTSYLASDRLFLSEEERAAMGRAMAMAEAAGGLLEFESLPLAIESPEFRGRTLLTLRDLLARIELPPLETVPDGAAMAAAGKTSWRVPGTGIEIRRMAEGPRTGEWLFTAETILRLPEWYDYASTLPYREEVSEGFRNLYIDAPIGLQWIIPARWTLDMPPFLTVRILNEPAWRWLGLLVALAAAWGVLKLVTRWRDWRDARTTEVTTGDLWRRLLVPFTFGLLIFGLRWLIAHGLRFSSTAYTVFMIGFTVLIYVVLIRLFWLAARAMADSVIATKRVNTEGVDQQLIRLTMRIIAVVLSLGVLIEGANRIGLPSYSIFTGLGVGGVAVALAARESLANLMGSFIVMIEKPFRVGQKIRVGGIEGVVEDIGFRSTRVRTSYDSLVIVPSSKILEAPVDNLGLRNARQVKTTIGVAYDTRRDVLVRFIDSVREIVAKHPQTRKSGIEVGLYDFTDSSLVIALDFLIDVRDGSAELRCRQDILLQIIECAEQFGIQFTASTDPQDPAPNPPFPGGGSAD